MIMGVVLHYSIFFMLYMHSLRICFSCLDGNCRLLAFPSYFLIADKCLESHTFLIVQHVPDMGLCELLCYNEPNCVSVNYEIQRERRCELNNSTHRAHDADFKKREGCLYHGASSACDNPCCHNNGTCQSGFTEKKYRCLCLSGFTGEHCENDINECKEGTQNCSSNAVCNNTHGSYNCTCKPGYEGDGNNCTDINECNAEIHNCSSNAFCNNTKGSYNCSCKPGYTRDGWTCTVCDSDWNRYGEKCYKLFTSVKNWNNAKATCDNHGASLVKIESHDENNFILATYLTGQVDYWIGLSDADNEGEWTWVDGTRLTGYDNWRSGQPNDANGGQDCAGIRMRIHHNKKYDAEWHDNSCQNTKGFICEKRQLLFLN